LDETEFEEEDNDSELTGVDLDEIEVEKVEGGEEDCKSIGHNLSYILSKSFQYLLNIS
jgi:hypothetical protein